jgi:hypothetical protein
MYTGRGPEFNDDIVYGVNVSVGGNGGFHIMQGLKYSIVHEFIVASINCIVHLVLYRESLTWLTIRIIPVVRL